MDFNQLVTSIKDIHHVLRQQSFRARNIGLAFRQFYGVYPEIVGTLSPLLLPKDYSLMECLSYSHLELLTSIEDEIKLRFYEVECIRGTGRPEGPYTRIFFNNLII
jgi:hypothetical protein